MRNLANRYSLYRHFKGKWYMLFDKVENTETGEITVAYTAFYGDGKSYNRDYDMFLSETDKEAHPEATQPYRFMSYSELVAEYGEVLVHSMIKDEIIDDKFIDLVAPILKKHKK